MAIDESLLGGVRPSESAVDRLRKRNRIRPWESGLVGAQPKQQSDVAGLGDSPPGQDTQGACDPEGKSPDVASAKKLRAEGVSASGSGHGTHGASRPPGSNLSEGEKCDPVGELPSGSPASGVANPQGETVLQTLAGVDHSQPAPPSGSVTPRVEHPGGKLPTGQEALGDKPTGSNVPGVSRPLGETSVDVSSEVRPSRDLTQRVKDPGGVSTREEDSTDSRAPLINGFDPTPFVPIDKGQIVWREKGSGELRIPHRLYEYAHRVTSTRNELLVFDCLLRFSLGFHRSWCEAGYSFIAAWTGISDITNIKKSLRTLLSAGIVIKTKDHDSASNSGSIYEVPVVKGYLEYLAKKTGAQSSRSANGPLGTVPTGHSNQRGEAPAAGRRETSGPVGDLPSKKENLKQIPKKTFSQETAEELDAYLDQIKPASKRESEIFFLGKLLPEYPSQDVAMALSYVRRFGVLGSAEECHSPLKYLANAIEQVLPKAREYQSLLRPIENNSYPSKGGQRSDEYESAQERFRSMALSEFETTASQEEQDRFLAEVTRENSVRGYAPPISVLRGMAALKWFEGCGTQKAGPREGE